MERLIRGSESRLANEFGPQGQPPACEFILPIGSAVLQMMSSLSYITGDYE